jgi:hypothetical protein
MNRTVLRDRARPTARTGDSNLPGWLALRAAIDAHTAALIDRDERSALAEQAEGEAFNAGLPRWVDASAQWRPVLFARETDDGMIAAWCPLCREEHIHRRIGNRQPHCPDGCGYNRYLGRSYNVAMRDDGGAP